MKSRIGTLIIHFSYLLTGIALLICAIMKASKVIYFSILLFLVSWFSVLIHSHCPHCGHIGAAHITPIRKTKEYCRHCGESIEYQ